jgi:RNA polymerase sigma-70 factor (ECF subfamily)
VKKRRAQRTRAEFEALVMPLMSSLYGLALHMTRDEERARDLVQDACLKAYGAFNRFELGTNFRAWIFKILTNTFISQYHRRKKKQTSAPELESRHHYQRFVGQGSCRSAKETESEVLDRMMSEDITQAVEELPEEFRLAVILSDIEEFSYKEIAEMLQCPVGTVMSRLYRGRRALQNLLYTHAVEKGIIEPDPDRERSLEKEEGPHSGRPKKSKASHGGALAGGRQAAVASIEEYRKRRGKT